MSVFNASSTLPADAILCFSTPPRRVVFDPGTRLYRLVTIVNAGFAGNEIFASPWWVPPDTYRQITKRAHRTGRSGVDVARAGLAVAYAWNPEMDWLVILELRRPVQGWVGPTRPQPLLSPDRSVIALGQLDQAYVPDLAPRGATATDAGVIAYFGSGLIG